MECSEIKVNSIPLNSFFNFTFGYEYTPSSDFGKGVHIAVDSSSLNETYSHFVTFDRTDEIFTCKTGYLGTYEIQAHVTYRNTSNSRHNPCIAIGVNDDVAVISIVGIELSSFHKPFNALIKNQITPILFKSTLVS